MLVTFSTLTFLDIVLYRRSFGGLVMRVCSQGRKLYGGGGREKGQETTAEDSDSCYYYTTSTQMSH